MWSLSNKVAIITGASSGIGLASANLFAQAGAKLVLGARRQSALNAALAQITKAGGAAIALAGDVQDESFARDLVGLAEREFGGLDIAFNNAGTLGAMGVTTEITREQWQATLDTNLTSAFLAAKYQLPAMLKRGRGSLIFTASFVGYTAAFAGAAAYAASKAGLIGFTKALAVEYGQRGIRVNALLPGGTDTPMAREMNSTEDAMNGVRQLHALKRIASPDEQAHSALYLASEASSFTTGTALLVDGGVSISRG